MSSLEAFSRSQRLTELETQLTEDRKALDAVLNSVNAQLEESIQFIQSCTSQFNELREQYLEITREFTDQLPSLESIQEMIDLNKKVMERLMK